MAVIAGPTISGAKGMQPPRAVGAIVPSSSPPCRVDAPRGIAVEPACPAPELHVTSPGPSHAVRPQTFAPQPRHPPGLAAA